MRILHNLKRNIQKVPLCNRPIFYEDNKKMGMINELIGPIDNFAFSVKPIPGLKASTFKKGEKIYGNPFHLKDVQFFIPRPKPPKGAKIMNNQGSAVKGPRKTGNMISKPWQKGPEKPHKIYPKKA